MSLAGNLCLVFIHALSVLSGNRVASTNINSLCCDPTTPMWDGRKVLHPLHETEMQWGYGSCCYKARVAESLTTLFVTVICIILSCTIMRTGLRLQIAKWCTKTHEEAIISLGTGFHIIYNRSVVEVIIQKNNWHSRSGKWRTRITPEMAH